MDRPVSIQRYVKLIVDEKLSNPAILSWYRSVRNTVPSGVIATAQATNDEYGMSSVSLVSREVGGKFEYIIPLVRDLTDKEIEPAIDDFAATHPEVNFDAEVSSAQTDHLMQSKPIAVADDKFDQLCTAWAKKQHEDWLKDRTDSGWRYGPTMSIRNQTHPLLRPWHDLPDQYRKIDFEQPQNLLDLLNDQGYAVISKEELEGILGLLRKRR